jgi:L-ascorbate metabolism protein UlaG (beta-lactamase superfamily)
MNRIAAFLLGASFTLLSQGQTNTITIRYIGNCGMQLTDGTKNIYVDFPYKPGAYGYMAYAACELDSVPAGSTFIFTHRHADHYSRKRLKPLKGRVYGPWKAPRPDRTGTVVLNDTVNALTVLAYRTKHRFALHHASYLFTWHGKRIFISGDTEHAELAGTMAHMDYAFVPVWLILDAKAKNITIDADHFAIYHLYPDQSVTTENPKIQFLRHENEVITVPF